MPLWLPAHKHLKRFHLPRTEGAAAETRQPLPPPALTERPGAPKARQETAAAITRRPVLLPRASTRRVSGPDETRRCPFQQPRVLAGIWQAAIREILFLNAPAAEVFLHDATAACQTPTGTQHSAETSQRSSLVFFRGHSVRISVWELRTPRLRASWITSCRSSGVRAGGNGESSHPHVPLPESGVWYFWEGSAGSETLHQSNSPLLLAAAGQAFACHSQGGAEDAPVALLRVDPRAECF